VASHREEIKREILKTFNKNVKGKIPDLSTYNRSHDGAEGDWLTIAMGLTVNGKNEPDFKGFEMKKDSKKTTFGDWQPDFALYKKPSKGVESELTRIDFLKIFGQKSKDQTGRKLGRYSCSGNVRVLYYFTQDKRNNKSKIVPRSFQKNKLVLVEWTNENLKDRLEKKFNKLGWFKCLTDSNGRYEKVQFGKPINFELFISMARSGDVFCDCGMYSTNPRPYMTWRASKNIWDSLAE